MHVLLFHFSVIWFSEMQFGVIYLKTWASTQSNVAFLIIVFCSCFFVFGRTHKAPNSLILHEPVSVVSSVKFLYLAREWGLSSSSCGRDTLPASCIRSLTNVSLNFQCDNFKPQEARMIQLLRMVRSIRWKNRFFIHIKVCLLVHHVVRFVHISHVSIIVLYYGQFHGFSMLITEITFQWWRMYVHQYVYILFTIPHYGCQVNFHLSL